VTTSEGRASTAPRRPGHRRSCPLVHLWPTHGPRERRVSGLVVLRGSLRHSFGMPAMPHVVQHRTQSGPSQYQHVSGRSPTGPWQFPQSAGWRGGGSGREEKLSIPPEIPAPAPLPLGGSTGRESSSGLVVLSRSTWPWCWCRNGFALSDGRSPSVAPRQPGGSPARFLLLVCSPGVPVVCPLMLAFHVIGASFLRAVPFPVGATL